MGPFPTDNELASLFPQLSKRGRRTAWLVLMSVTIADAAVRNPELLSDRVLGAAGPTYAQLLGQDPAL